MFKFKKSKNEESNIITPTELEKQIQDKLELGKKKNEELIPYFCKFFEKLFSDKYKEYFDLAEKYNIDCVHIYCDSFPRLLDLIIDIKKDGNSKVEYVATFMDSHTMYTERILRAHNIIKKNYDINVKATYTKDTNKIYLHDEGILKNDKHTLGVWKHVQEKLCELNENEFWNITVINELSRSILDEVDYDENKDILM